jgi:hypothetical protein
MDMDAKLLVWPPAACRSITAIDVTPHGAMVAGMPYLERQAVPHLLVCLLKSA